MKGLFVLLTVVSVATAYVTYPSPATVNGINCPFHKGCPEIDNPLYTVHLADESDCHQYYKCVSGRGCRQLCPRYNEGQSRLVFNPHLEVCDWPENVPEIVCKEPTPTEATPTKPTEATPTKPTEATPSKPTEATPTKPTEATPSKPTEATPSKPTEATPSKPTEATPSKPTEATPSKPTESTPTKATDVPTEPGKCPKHGDLLISHETECRAYYSCHNGQRSSVQYCLEGNVFNPIQHTCDLLTNETSKYCLNGVPSN